jgi:hypothetical protein
VPSLPLPSNVFRKFNVCLCTFDVCFLVVCALLNLLGHPTQLLGTHEFYFPVLVYVNNSFEYRVLLHINSRRSSPVVDVDVQFKWCYVLVAQQRDKAGGSAKQRAKQMEMVLACLSTRDLSHSSSRVCAFYCSYFTALHLGWLQIMIDFSQVVYEPRALR